MRGMLKLVVLLVFASQLTGAQNNARASEQSVETVNFCELFQHPERYQSETVETSTIYEVDLERTIFFDGACSMEATANAVFSDRTRGTKKIAKALRKTKLRPALLDVTIVATFVDKYASNTITFRGHR